MRVNPQFQKKVDEIQKSFLLVEGVKLNKNSITKFIADRVTFEDVNFFSRMPNPPKRKKKKLQKALEQTRGDIVFGPMFKNE